MEPRQREPTMAETIDLLRKAEVPESVLTCKKAQRERRGSKPCGNISRMHKKKMPRETKIKSLSRGVGQRRRKDEPKAHKEENLEGEEQNDSPPMIS